MRAEDERVEDRAEERPIADGRSDEEPVEDGRGDLVGAAPAGRCSVAATALVWSSVGCWAVAAAVRLAGIDRIPKVDVLLTGVFAFYPYAVVAAVVTGGCAVLARRWRAAAVAGALAVLLATVIVPRVVADGSDRAHGPVLRVLTVNMLFGQADPAGVVALARRTRADVLSVQEMTPAAVAGLRRAGIARQLPNSVLTPARSASGSGLFARYRLTRLGEVGGAKRPGRGGAGGRTGFAMPRARLDLPGAAAGVEVVSVHTVPPTTLRDVRETPGRVGKWTRDLKALRTLPPVPTGSARILAGDFNATLDHARLRALLDSGYRNAADVAGQGLRPTYGDGTIVPPITIDHILTDLRIGVRAVSVHPIPGSDHRAVAAELRLP